MDFKHLQSYSAVVKYRSFTKAAQKTGISQPTISSHIQQLETELETRLILRTTKSIKLTQCGEELYQYAQSVLDNRDRLLRRWNSSTKNVIHLGVSTIPSAYILPETLPAFQKEHPDVRFTIHQSDSHGVAEGLLSGGFDLGIIGMDYQDDRVVCTPFCQDRMVLITQNSPHFAALLAEDASPGELIARHPVILRENSGGGRKQKDRIIAAFGFSEEDVQIVARLNDQEAIKNLVASGLGISVVSQRAARKFIESGLLLSFALPDALAERSFYLMTRSDGLPNQNAADLRSFILRQYRAEPESGTPDFARRNG